FAALGVPIVGMLFQTGQFGANDTRIVASVLTAYAVGLPAQASVKLLASALYAMGDQKSPVKAAAISMVLSAILAYVLMQRLGPIGIALGASIASYVNVFLHFHSLSGRLGSLVGERTLPTFGVVIASAFAAAAAGMGLWRLIPNQPLWIVAATTLTGFG